MTRPYVLLSVAVSLDGHIDDGSPDRLRLSGPEDSDRVDAERAESDAILVGAGTIRADNPTLLVRDERRRAERVARGRPEHPLKVTATATGNLDSRLAFWHHGDARLVYTTHAGAERLGDGLMGLAEVVALGSGQVDVGALLDDLGGRGVSRLLVEGGTQVHTAFLSQGLADELHLAVAPIIVGDAGAPRFLGPASYPPGRLALAEARPVGDIVLLRYRCR
jgi:5-amino-6-(5-phosphoribosylamino)uracil reductase